jgi:hypothetical protein
VFVEANCALLHRRPGDDMDGCKKCLRLGGKVANSTRDTADKMRLLVMAEAWLDLADRASRFAKSHARSIADHPLVRRVFGGEATAHTQPWAR